MKVTGLLIFLAGICLARAAQFDQSLTKEPKLAQLQAMYIDLLKLAVSGVAYAEYERVIPPGPDLSWDPSMGVLGFTGSTNPFDPQLRLHGNDWPLIGVSMIGLARLNNLETMLRIVVAEGIPGDFIECGVWRGGASIMARGVLSALGDRDRKVVLADSFQGLPPKTHAKDGDSWDRLNYVTVPLDSVQNNFKNFNLMDHENVRFIRGFFNESLPRARASLKYLSIIRADGDMYSSTMDILFNLYGRLSIGGFVMFDDAPNIPECNQAIEDFRSWHRITEPIVYVDPPHYGLYWRKQRHIDTQIDLYYGGAKKLLSHIFPLTLNDQ